MVRKLCISDVYENDWPIREALKMRLKSSSETARRQAQRVTDRTLKKVSLTLFLWIILTLNFEVVLESAHNGKT